MKYFLVVPVFSVGDMLVCNPYIRGKRQQQFCLTGEYVHWIHDMARCVDITGAARMKGAKVTTIR